MNFDYMPELQWRYGYFVVLGRDGARLRRLLICWFKRKKWI